MHRLIWVTNCFTGSVRVVELVPMLAWADGDRWDFLPLCHDEHDL